jgi:general secretion pathway protein K
MIRATSRRAPRVADESGIALLIVLLVVTLLTVTVMEFAYSVQLDQHRVRNALHALQANLLARSGINLAEGFLLVDEEQNYDAYTEEWWLLLDQFCQEVPLDPTMRIRCRVSDESGKININLTRTRSVRQGEQLATTKDAFLRDALRRLFETYNIEVDIVDRLAEYWLEEPPVSPTDDRLRPQQMPAFGSLEDFAARFKIPTAELARLRKVLTAQPTGVLPAININTASAEVLSAVINDAAAVDEVLARQQEEEPFINAGQIREALGGIEDVGTIASLFTIRSSLFQLQASALANVDPLTLEGGIGQTLNVLVVRRRDPKRQQPDSNLPGWTSRALDWQKEAGARLMQQTAEEDESRFDRLEENDREDRGINSLDR